MRIKTGELWCALCGQWTDHQSGHCPHLEEPEMKLNPLLTPEYYKPVEEMDGDYLIDLGLALNGIIAKDPNCPRELVGRQIEVLNEVKRRVSLSSDDGESVWPQEMKLAK